MRRLLIPLLMLTFVGCLSPQMKQELEDAGAGMAKKAMKAAVEEGKTQAEKLSQEWYQKGLAAGRAEIEARIKADKDLAPKEKDDLLAQLANAGGGILGIGGVLVAYAKAKGAAKLRNTVGVLVKASQELPEASLAVLKGEVKKLGGDHPSIASIIAEAKNT
jgi:hypothetical protein